MFAGGQEERKQKDLYLQSMATDIKTEEKKLLTVYKLICTVQVVLHFVSPRGKKI